ncbi:MAG: hypothetical protein HOY71_52635 [Nonomuraea sp.]|nr:hypothetical protein [Nonomuraea sp.]
MTSLGIGGVAFGLGLAALAVALRPTSTADLRQVYKGSYLLPQDLDQQSAELLGRAERAIHLITTSQVNVDGLIDDVRNAVVLPAEKWEIAKLLAEMSDLRRRRQHALRETASPLVAAAAAPLERSLRLVEAAVTARVETLEQYVREVQQADAAHVAGVQLAFIRAEVPRYEEIVARSTTGSATRQDLEELTRGADDLEQAINRDNESSFQQLRPLDPDSTVPMRRPS